MKVVILAAGLGSRLLPHTSEVPKCLLEINGKPIIQHQLEALRSNNLKDVIIVVGYKNEKIKEFLSKEEFSDFNFEIIENKDFKNTNSSYSLWLAKDKIKGGFIYLNSDLVFHEKMLQNLLNHEASSSIIISKDTNLNDDMFKIKLEGDNIKTIDKKLPLNESHGKAIGPVKIGSEHAQKFLEKLDKTVLGGEKNKWVYTLLHEFAQENTFKALEDSNLYWGEIDTQEDIEKIESILK